MINMKKNNHNHNHSDSEIKSVSFEDMAMEYTDSDDTDFENRIVAPEYNPEDAKTLSALRH